MSDYVVGLDSIIRNRDTGEMVEEAIEVIATTQSLKQAISIVREIVEGSEWIINTWGDFLPVFTKTVGDNIFNEIYIEKKSRRQWKIIKRVGSIE